MSLQAQVLTFEGINDWTGVFQVPIGNFYNGGGGPDYGIEFSENSLALCLNTATRSCSNTSRGETGNPASRNSAMYFQTGPSAFMNRETGFTTGFSFFYAAPFTGTASFNVWSDLDGTGTLLASLILPQTPESSPPPCYGADYCTFFPAGVSFDGTARSVTFTGTDRVVFDDITFGSATPGVDPSVVPEPATVALLGSGLAVLFGVGYTRRRREA